MHYLEPNNFDIRLFLKHKQHFYFKNWNLWNRWLTKWGNKNKVLTNILHKLIYIKNCLYWHLYLQLRNIFTLKRSSTFANLLMEKPVNWFATVKMWKKKTQNKKNLYLKNLHLYLKNHSGTVFSSCLCKSTSWFLRKRNIDSKRVIPNN